MESIFDLLAPPNKRPRRTMIYGEPGVGKTLAGSKWKGRVAFMVTEDGLQDIPNVMAWPMLTKLGDILHRKTVPEGKTPSFMGLVAGIAAKDMLPIDSLVIDTADGLHALVVDYVNDAYSAEERSYGKDTVLYALCWQAILNALEWLNIQKGLEIVLLAHSQVDKFADPLGDSYNYYRPRMHVKSADLVFDWCDEVLFFNYSTMIVKKKEGFNRERNVAVESGARVLFSASKPGYMAKSRIPNLPEEIPVFETSTYHDLIGQYLPADRNSQTLAG